MTSYVYVIHAGDAGPFKIGVTDNVAARCMALQGADAHPIQIDAVLPFDTRAQANIIESTRRFASRASGSPTRVERDSSRWE